MLAASVRVNAIQVGVDPSKSWIGYMNVFELPANGGGYDFGSSWGTADLDASFSGTTLTLTPNTSIDRDVPNDPYWWVGGAGGAPNKTMDASMYVEDDTLAGQTVTFAGNTSANTLVSPYTCVAFIKDFTPGYSLNGSVTLPVVGGQGFSITLATAPGDHIQYGFETIGPDARLASVSTLGSVIIVPVTLLTNGVACSIAAGTQVSWVASSANSYEPQKSADNSVWTDFGTVLSGNSVTSRFDTATAPHYRVLELVPGSADNVLLNPGFEVPAANAIGAANWNIAVLPNAGASMWVTNQYGAISAHSGTNFLFIESATAASGAVSAPNTDVRSDFIPVTAGTTYNLSFYAANPVKTGGANPQYDIFFYNAANGAVGGPVFTSFASVGSSWTQVSTTVTPPAGATQLTIGWIQAAGAGNGEDWVTLIDDVSLSTGPAAPGSTNVLAAAVQPGVQVSWASSNGSTYQVQSAAGLRASPAWSAFGGTVTGNGTTNSVNDSAAAVQKYYRVLQLP